MNTLPHDHLLFQAMPQQYKPLPTQERLHELFDYSVITGTLTRKIGVRGSAAGLSVGSQNGNGYLRTTLSRVKIYNHRVIWKWVTGEDPSERVDHADGDRTNNAWHNLRLATQSQNLANHRLRSNNTSGFKGVSRHSGGKWVAMVWKDYKPYHLGYFDTPEEAHAAYMAAAERLHGEFARAA